MQSENSFLDKLQNYPVWKGLSLARLIPLLETADACQFSAGELLAEQFHPATHFHLLCHGRVSHSGTSESRIDTIAFDPVHWEFAAIGWSGFLSPQRYGTTVRAETNVTTLCWSHASLAQMFYADPELSMRFFDLVFASVCRQLTDLRASRLLTTGVRVLPPVSEQPDHAPPCEPADTCLRRSSFFAAFDERSLATLASSARAVYVEPGAVIVHQDEEIDGLLLLASGRCNAYFVAADQSLLPFRRFHDHIGIIAGLPLPNSHFAAESSVFAESGCWVYRLPAATIESLKTNDPEIGRSFQQRLLTRLAALIAVTRVVQGDGTPDPEVSAVATIIANNRARVPVTSELHKVPHLLRSRLTTSNALDVLKRVAEGGRYPERQLAAQCFDQLSNLAAENAFYLGIVNTCDAVINAEESLQPAAVRELCDALANEAFAHLDCRVDGLHKLPEKPGCVFIMNHLSCPEFYELPNHYHFSFDTAFVSCLLWKHYAKSPIRVVRQSPGAEFAHDLFYRRLQPISVPTIESGIDTENREAFAERRREASLQFRQQGVALLSAGENLLVCPEGQSQRPEDSPARFHTGAFRLAMEAGAAVVPIALAGFHRRYKDGPLVAKIDDPIDVAATVPRNDHTDVRHFADSLRAQLEVSVRAAMQEAAQPAVLVPPT